MSAFFTAFVFRCLFNESLFCKHYVGMVFLLIAIVIIALGEQSSGEEDEEMDSILEGFPKISIWVPISIVVINAVVHTSVSVSGRYFLIHGGMPSFDFSMDAFALHAVTLILGYCYFCYAYGPIPGEIMKTTAIGSIFNMSGFILYSEACVYGKAGPAQILMELQSIW